MYVPFPDGLGRLVGNEIADKLERCRQRWGIS